MTTPGQAGRPARLSRAADLRQDRDEEVTRFFDDHWRDIRAYLIASFRCTGPEADDLVQESILAIRDHWERVRTLEKPVAYWYKVVGRRFLRDHGERSPRESGGDPGELLAGVPDPHDPFKTVDDRLLVVALLGELPPRQRQVAWLRRAAGFTDTETAAILSIRPGTVKSILHDADIRLQELARKHDGTWEAGVR